MSERKSMLKIREILRQRELGQELRAIGLSVGASPSTVHEYLRRARNADVSAAASQAMSDSELKERLFPKGRGGDGTASQRAPFDCGHVHLELRRVGVTLQLLWAEYVEASEAQGLRPYSYSQYCDRYSLFKKTLSRSMRQEHVAGEKGFIDYSGKKPSIVDRSTGEAREVELFVMTLGASGYCFAEASLTQTASLENVVIDTARGLERATLKELGSLRWLEAHRNLILVGATGTGKSYLATALAEHACRRGHRALLVRMPRLFEELAIARAQGNYASTLARFEKFDLLVLDDFLMTPLSDGERRDLLELIDDRHERSATIFTSQTSPKTWHAAIGDPTIADAICDRIVHHSKVLALKGPSLRKPQTQAT